MQGCKLLGVPLHFLLAKTGLRVGELVHLLIEEVDLEARWLQIRNKTALGWRVKTGTERLVPLVPEVVAVLQRVIGSRTAGPVFLRARFTDGAAPPLVGDRAELGRICEQRQHEAGVSLSRAATLGVARSVWRDAGAIKADAVRLSFMRIMRSIGHPEENNFDRVIALSVGDARAAGLVNPVVCLFAAGSAAARGIYTHFYDQPPTPARRQFS